MTDVNHLEGDVRTLAISRSSVMRGIKKRRVSFLDIKRFNEQVQTYKLQETDVIIGRTSDNTL